MFGGRGHEGPQLIAAHTSLVYKQTISMPRATLYLHPNTNTFGKTDAIRCTLAEAGWDFSEQNDVAVDKAKELSGSLTGNLPMLHCEGHYFVQQTAILRFVGRKAGLYPTSTRTVDDCIALANIDTLISCSLDFIGLLSNPFFRRAKSEAEKREVGSWGQPNVEKHLLNFARLLGTNDTFSAPKLTIGDLCVYTALELARRAVPNTFAEARFASLSAFVQRIEERPRIAKWLASAAGAGGPATTAGGGGGAAAASAGAAGASAGETGPIDWDGLVAEAGLAGQGISLECSLSVLAEAGAKGRMDLLKALKDHGISKLGDRQKLAGPISKALRAGRELVDGGAPSDTAAANEATAVDEMLAKGMEGMSAVDVSDAPTAPDASSPVATAAPREPLTLYYWPSHGRGEMIRLVLSEGGLTWTQPSWSPTEDEAKRDAYFADCRKLGGHLTTNLPLLHMDERYVTQTASLLRYLGRRLGLYPLKVETSEDIIACYRIDVLIGAADDLRDANYSAAQGISVTRLQYAKSTVHPHLANFARLLDGAGGTYLSGAAPTVGDFTVYDVLVVAEKQIPKLLDAYPTLSAFRDRVAARPAIARWNASEMKGLQTKEHEPVVNPDGSPVIPEWEPTR